MHTARSSGRPGGVLHQAPTPQEEAPPRTDPPEEAPPPRRKHPPWKKHPPLNRITDACENITLPQLRCGR